MGQVTVFGVGGEKSVFELHGAAADWPGMFRKKPFAHSSPSSMPAAIEPVDHLNLH
jgi:hypothetical protein